MERVSLASLSTLEELADIAGIDKAGLVAQIQAHNVAVRAGTLASSSPARSIHKLEAFLIDKARFYAIPAVAGVTYTMGGIAINADVRVLTSEGHPLPGLYAVGCATGGLEGGKDKGYVGGLVKPSVTGLRCAEAILSVETAAA